MRSTFRSVFLLFGVLIVGLSGCAVRIAQSGSSASVGGAASEIAPAERLRTIVIVLSAAPEVRRRDGWGEFVEAWNAAIPNAANERNVSARMLPGEEVIPADADVLVRVRVIGFRVVSTAKRFMMGIAAGNAHMDLDIEYLRMPSSQVLDAKKVNTTSKASEGVFSAVTSRQVAAVARIIIQDALAEGGVQNGKMD